MTENPKTVSAGKEEEPKSKNPTIAEKILEEAPKAEIKTEKKLENTPEKK